MAELEAVRQMSTIQDRRIVDISRNVSFPEQLLLLQRSLPPGWGISAEKGHHGHSSLFDIPNPSPRMPQS